MNLSIITNQIKNNHYKSNSFSKDFNLLIDLYQAGDRSLLSKTDIFNIEQSYPENRPAMIRNYNITNLIAFLKRFITANASQITKNDLIRYINTFGSSDSNCDFYYRIFNFFSLEDNIELITLIKKTYQIDEFEYSEDIIVKLLEKNNLSANDFKTLLYLLNPYDIESIIDVISDEFIPILFEYDARTIDYIPPENITPEMIFKAVNSSNYSLSQSTPQVIKDNPEYVKQLIARDPNSIINLPEYLSNPELVNIAISNGLSLSYNQFKDNNIFDDSILIKELKEYASQTKQSDQYVTMRIVVNPEHETNNVNHIYQLLKYALTTNQDIQESIAFMQTFPFSLLLSDFERSDKDISFILSNEDFVIPLLSTIGFGYANKVTFEPSPRFVNAFYENGHYLYNCTETIKESSLMFKTAFQYGRDAIIGALLNGSSFITKEYIDKAIAQNVDILSHNINENTDPILKEPVTNFLESLPDSEYKTFLKEIIAKAGYTICYIESDSILSKEVYDVFGPELITKLVRHLCFCGCRLDFKPLIQNNLLNLFKDFYFNEKNNDNPLEFAFVYKFFIDNTELVQNLYSTNMTPEEHLGLQEYMHHKDRRFIIDNRKYLSQMPKVIYQVNSQILEENYDISEYKSIIYSTIFGFSYNEIPNIIGLIGNERINSLKASISEPTYHSTLDTLTNYISFIEKINLCNNVDLIKEVALKCNEFYLQFPNLVKKIKNLTSNINTIVKMLYTEDLNHNLTQLEQSDYIEFTEDSYFLAHVMNAFGQGSTLEDFKNPRFIGKTYICLSAIGKGVDPYYRKETSMNNVTLLFNHIPNQSLISMSNRDMWSSGGNGTLDVFVRNNFDTLFNILDKTEYIPNEYVVYRENEQSIPLYPCGILVIGDAPSEYERQAAEFLKVPLVKRKKITKEIKNHSNNAMIAGDLSGIIDFTEDVFYSDMLEKINSISKEDSPSLI